MGNASVNAALRVPRSGFVGQLVDTSWLTETETGINSGNQSAQTARATLSTTTAGTVHSVSFSIVAMAIVAQVVSVTANGTDTIDQIATKLADKVNATAGVASTVIATALGSGGILDIAGRTPKSAYTVLAVSNSAISLSVAANAAAVIYPGRAVAWTGSQSEQVNISAMSTALYLAQVDTGVVTFENASIAHWSIDVDNATYSGSVTMATDATTTAGLLEAQINQAMPSGTVIATSPTTSIVLTSELAGKPFKTTIYLTNQTTGAVTLTSTASLGTDAIKSLWGGALKSFSNRGPSAGDSTEYYKANDTVRVARHAAFWVEGVGINRLDPVYLDLTPGDNAGKFYNSAGSGRLLLPSQMAKWGVQGDVVAELQLSL